MTDNVKTRIDLFKKGFSINEVSKLTGEKYKTVEGTARLFRKQGGIVNKQKTNFVNHTYFDTIDTEEKAYLLGFFLADGCIDGSKNKNGNFNNRLSVRNSIDDLETIKLFNSEIYSNKNIEYVDCQQGAKYRKKQCVFRWTSSHMTNTLINKYNFCRKKAYNHNFLFPFNTIPFDLKRHFVRGFFDGDGNVDFSKVKTVNDVMTHRFQVTLISNSIIFANQLSDLICNVMSDTVGTISKIQGKSTIWFVLRFNTHRINTVDKHYQLYKWLYEDSHVFLTRKKNKFNSFFEYRGKELV
jgi:hypothetical protein